MGDKDAKIYSRLEQFYRPNSEEIEQGLKLFNDYMQNGRLSYSALQMQSFSKATLANFYYRLARFTTPGRPFYRKQSTKWLVGSNIFCLNLRQTGGFWAVLSLLPLLRYSHVVIEDFFENDAEGAIKSHKNIWPFTECDDLITQAGFTEAELLGLFLEIFRRFGIGFGFSLSLQVSPQAYAVLRRPDFFTASPYGVIFDLEKELVQKYLATIVSDWQQTYHIDFLVLNFSFNEYLRYRRAIDDFLPTLRPRASFGLVGINFKHDLLDFSISEDGALINIEHFNSNLKPFWHYLSQYFLSFHLWDRLYRDEEVASYYQSRLVERAFFTKATLEQSFYQESYAILLYSYKQKLIVMVINYHLPFEEQQFSVAGYVRGNTSFYNLQSDSFNYPNYQISAKTFSTEPMVTLKSLMPYSIAFYSIEA